MKNTLGGINSRINGAEEQISVLEDRVVEISTVEQNKIFDLWNLTGIYTASLKSLAQHSLLGYCEESFIRKLLTNVWATMGKITRHNEVPQGQ